MAERSTAKKSMVTSAIFAAKHSRSAVYVSVEMLLFLINILVVINVSNIYRPPEAECIKPAVANSLSGPLSGRDPFMWLPEIKKKEIKQYKYDLHLFTVIHTMGYKGRKSVGDPRSDPVRDWDLLCTNFDPYFGSIGYIKPYQKINHVPGIQNISNEYKVLIRSRDLGFLPRLYIIRRESDQFLPEVESHPDKLWLTTVVSERRSKVMRAEEIDLSTNKLVLVQEFVENPYLVDNRKFTIGVYVLVTSLDPFRIYVYDDVILEFSSKDYDPQDVSDQRWFFSGHLNSARFWELDSMKKFSNEKMNIYSQRKMLEEHIRETTGKDPRMLYDQIHNAVEQLFLQEGEAMKRALDSLKHVDSQHIFELMKWRFMLDDQANLFLVEAGVIPPLNKLSTERDAETQLITQIYYSMINIVGIPQNYLHDIDHSAAVWDIARLRDSDVFVYQDLCYTEPCSSCKLGCELCPQCLSPENGHMLKSTNREQLKQVNQRRVMPSIQVDSTGVKLTKKRITNKNDILTTTWLDLKCRKEEYWCS